MDKLMLFRGPQAKGGLGALYEIRDLKLKGNKRILVILMIKAPQTCSHNMQLIYVLFVAELFACGDINMQTTVS